MGEIKISNLDPVVSIIGTDIVVGVKDGITKKIKAEDILMTKSLSAIKWEDFTMPVFSTKLGGSKDPDFVKMIDDGSGSQGVFTFAFDKNTEEELYFAIQLPHSWKIGTDLGCHVNWAPSDTDTGTIQWGLEYNYSEDDEVFGNTIIALSAATAAPGVALQHTHLDIVDIDLSAIIKMSPIIMCRIFRNVSVDTYNADAFLLHIDFHYQVDALGSVTERIK